MEAETVLGSPAEATSWPKYDRYRRDPYSERRSRRVYRLVCFSGCNGDDPTPDDPVALGHAHRVRVGICALNQILPANRYRVGWKHRGSLRLPICPKHARAGDLPY